MSETTSTIPALVQDRMGLCVPDILRACVGCPALIGLQRGPSNQIFLATGGSNELTSLVRPGSEPVIGITDGTSDWPTDVTVQVAPVEGAKTYLDLITGADNRLARCQSGLAEAALTEFTGQHDEVVWKSLNEGREQHHTEERVSREATADGAVLVCNTFPGVCPGGLSRVP